MAADKMSVVIGATRYNNPYPPDRHTFSMNVFDAATITKLGGVPINARLGIEDFRKMSSLWRLQTIAYATASPISHTFQKMNVTNAAQFLLNPTEGENQRLVAAKKFEWDAYHRTPGENKTLAQYFVYPTAVLPEMKLDEIPLNETVSLRPEFVKFGIKPMSESTQVIGCQTQAFYKIMNFWLAKKGLPKLSLEQYLSVGIRMGIMDKGNRPNRPIGIYSAQYGSMLAARIKIQPKRMVYHTSHKALDYEIAKHMLRKGYPLLANTPSNLKGKFHVVVFVGFKTVEGVTQFEVLDHDYHWEPKLISNSECWAIWYE